MLVKHLAKLRMLNPTVLLRIGLWAAAYKLRLPQNEAWVRGLVFRAFAGKPKAEVDAFLHDFYDECVAPHVREQARQAMDSWHEQGVTVICVSATFEPIIERAMRDLPFDYQISTRMKVNYDGTYACEVDGVPVEEYSLAHLRDAVAMVLQKNTLFSGSLRENLLWGNPEAPDEELLRACRIARVDEFLDRLF